MHDTANTCTHIAIDQGIDSGDDGLNITQDLDPAFLETAFIIKVDHRLLRLQSYTEGPEYSDLTNQFIDDDFPDEEVSSPESAQEQSAQSVPPPIPEAPVIPEAPAVQVEQTVIEPLPVEETASAPEIEEDQTEDPEPPPPPPAPAAKRSKAPQKSSSKEDSDAASSQSITPRSKRIKGLNRRQTVIVVKGQSVFSKIYTTSLIFLILFIIACLIAIGGLFFSYESVAPVLEGMGLPSGIIETFEPQKQTSGIESDENGFVLYSASCLTSFSEKNKSGGG